VATAAQKARAGKGRKERANSPTGKLRAPNLGSIYTKALRDVDAGDFDFRVVLVRPEKAKDDGRLVILDRATTSVEWTDESAVLAGGLTLHRPNPLKPSSLPVKERHRVRLLVQWGGTWYRLWEMRVESEPEPTGSSGDLRVELSDDLASLRQNVRDWEFKKGKNRPKGWPPEAITKNVCNKEGVRMGKIAKGAARIKKLKKTCSGLEVIMRAYAAERQKSDRAFVIRLRNGRLEVVPVSRHRVLYEIRGVELDYSTETSSPKKGRPTTVIEAKGRVGKKKVEAKVFRRSILKRFGLSTAEKSYGKVDSKQELREKAMRDLAEQIRVTRRATLTIPGIPFMERGDTVRWLTEETGWSGPSFGTQDRSYGYITGVTHAATPASFTSTVTLSQTDPFLKTGAGGSKAKRDEKKGQRNKRRRSE
jgi:hypothetical protein